MDLHKQICLSSDFITAEQNDGSTIRWRNLNFNLEGGVVTQALPMLEQNADSNSFCIFHLVHLNI